MLECRNGKQHGSSVKLNIRYRMTRQLRPWALVPEQVTQTPGRTQSGSILRQIPKLGWAQMSFSGKMADPAVVRPRHGTLLSNAKEPAAHRTSAPGNRRLRETPVSQGHVRMCVVAFGKVESRGVAARD